MAWTLLFLAGLLEVGWAIGLKYTEGFTRPLPTVLTVASMIASMAHGPTEIARSRSDSRV